MWKKGDISNGINTLLYVCNAGRNHRNGFQRTDVVGNV